jgi:hypothetical protein
MKTDREVKTQMVRDAKAQVGRVRGLKWVSYRWTGDTESGLTLAGVSGFCRRCGARVELSVEEARTYDRHNCR